MFNLRQSLISLAIGLGILGVGTSSSLATDKPWTVGYCTASTSFVKPTVDLGFPYANLEAKLVYGQYGRSWRYSDVSVVFNQVVNTVRKVKAGEVLAVAYGHDITPTYLETEGYIFFKFDLVDAERAINQIKDDCSRVPKNKHPQEF